MTPLLHGELYSEAAKQIAETILNLVGIDKDDKHRSTKIDMTAGRIQRVHDAAIAEMTDEIERLMGLVEGRSKLIRCILAAIPSGQEITVSQIKIKIGDDVAEKKVSNALGYLVRRGELRKSGYGRYIKPEAHAND